LHQIDTDQKVGPLHVKKERGFLHDFLKFLEILVVPEILEFNEFPEFLECLEFPEFLEFLEFPRFPNLHVYYYF
jgi:hypothetical protein